VSVVNSYAAVSDAVLVVFDSNVDFPTEGKPISATRASSRETTSSDMDVMGWVGTDEPPLF
jgi:hypothetical protein